ncbi:ElyC/SanA/YdcF family protein, partial [uncultured Duncaniella sp.]|uniref:SanA/YdcF family protein n=1 Tax=uncultured Duncaniella sp. TaxID=2768039 RepID=UPI0025B221BD
MTHNFKLLIKRLALSLAAFLLLIVAFTVYANVMVEKAANERVYTSVDAIPYNRVALLLGTNPLNKWGRPNSYFTNRIKTASELFHAGKVDYIIASGDNHTKDYDEPTAMRDSLMAHGVPEDRIILDFAGFRTLDSVVRAKEIFGCDSLTIISQADHNARALYLAEANGIESVAVSAPLRAGKWVRTRLAIREWLARDKMMLDIWFGKQPHFLGERIEIPDV